MEKSQLRVRAETVIQALDRLAESGNDSSLDVKELAEALRIYQAELAQQNQELKAANLAVDALLRHYHDLFLNLPLPALVVNPDGTISESNQAARQIFPVLETSSRVLSVYSIQSQVSDGTVSDILRATLEGGVNGRGEVVFQTALNPSQPFQVFTYRMPAEAMNTGPVLVILVDRSAAQVEREWSERLFKISAHIPGMLYQFVTRPDGKMTFPFVTPGIEKLFGVTPSEAAADATVVFNRIHPDDVPPLIESIQRSQSRKMLWKGFYRVNQPSGKQIWIRGEASPEPLPDGSTMWHGYSYDVTAEVQLQEQLRREKQRLADVIDGTGVGTWEWNVQTGETRFNERWAGMLGYTLEELQPVSIATWMRLADPDDLKRSEDQLQRHFNGELEYYEAEARMQHREGRWVWVLDRGRVITRTPEGLPEWMAGTHLDITERKIMEARLSQLANHDSLTGLPRRTLFADRLAQAMAQARRRNTRLALAFIDLDGFKAINDVHGHAGGDRLLVELARRMSSLLRSGDTVARLGGDEFVMILSDLQPDDDGLKHLQRVTAALSQPVDFEGKALAITSSVGVAHYPAEVDIDQDELVRRADKAMYAAKSAGKNRICVG